MTWEISWSLAGVEDTIPCPSEAVGSVVGCENQSLGEDVEVVGTPFALHYRSDRVAGRFLASAVATAHTKQLGGWTLGVHHAYDATLNTVYLGSGAKRDNVSLHEVRQSAAGEYLVASRSADEVYVFDAEGRHRQTRRALTGAVLYQFGYDAKKRLVTITDGDSNITEIERDADGHPAAIVAPFGQRTTLTVDANGYLATITDPAGHVVKLATTATGLVTALTNARGMTSRFGYDDDGRLIRDDDPAGGFQTLARTEDSAKFTIARSTATNRTFRYEVTAHPGAGEERVISDAAGLKTRIARNASGTETSTAPDGETSSQTLGSDPRFGRSGAFIESASRRTPGGRTWTTTATRSATLSDSADSFSLTEQQETTTVNGKVSKRTYDGLSRVLTVTSPAGRKSTHTLDTAGRTVKTQVPGLWPTIYTYDTRGRVVAARQGIAPSRRITQFTYGADGFLASITNPLGQKLRLTRNAAGRIISKTLPDGRVVRLAYDGNGNPRSVTPPGRPSHAFAYSAVDLPRLYAAPLVGTEPNRTLFAYNRDRQLIQVKQPDGKTIRLGYDNAGRPSTVTLARGTLTYAYDAVTGHISSVNAPGGIELAFTYDGSLPTAERWAGPVTGQVGYAYDNDFRTTAIRLNGRLLTTYRYDPDGLLVKAGPLTLNPDADNGLLASMELGLTVKDRWAYNRFGEPIDYQASYDGNALFSTHYTRDKLGRISGLAETVLGETTQRAYRYSATGRLLKVSENGVVKASYTYDANGNRLSITRNGQTTTGTYDAQDRLTQYGTRTYAYTANGELARRTVGRQVTRYHYDALGNLTEVTLPDGTTIGYLIDGQNRRIGKKRNGTLVKAHLYQDQLRPVAELNGAGRIISRFIYAEHANVPDLMIRGGVTYRIITDHLGSPRLVVNSETGAVAQRIDYDEFGRITRDTNPGFQPFGFAGGLYDRDTKLVRFGARDYDPETGRWTAKDPILFAAGDLNLYGYVGNDPLNFHDFLGLQVRPPPFRPPWRPPYTPPRRPYRQRPEPRPPIEEPGPIPEQLPLQCPKRQTYVDTGAEITEKIKQIMENLGKNPLAPLPVISPSDPCGKTRCFVADD